MTYESEVVEIPYFHKLWESGRDRRAALMHLATVVIERPPDWNREAMRAVPPMHDREREGCFLCAQTLGRLIWHHVVLVKHGGSNCPWNLVKLCDPCHADIHPWLKPITATGSTRSGFTSMGEMFAIANADLKRRNGR